MVHCGSLFTTLDQFFLDITSLEEIESKFLKQFSVDVLMSTHKKDFLES